MVIKVTELSFEYPGKRALDSITFNVKQGSVTALVGPNGAGKTTLLRCIAALEEPFSGSIEVADIDVLEEPRRAHKQIGYLSDFFGLYEDLTIEQCLIFAARSHQIDEADVRKHVRWAIDILGLKEFTHKKAGTLSRGWRQRLGIAQAIIHKPKILLLDEPASGLDPEARISLSRLFNQLRNEGMTLIVSSHILAELEDYCTEMLVLREGRVVEYQAHDGTEEKVNLIKIDFLDDADKYLHFFHNYPNASNVVQVGEKGIHLHLKGDDSEKNKLLKALMQQNYSISNFSSEARSLQDVYMSLSTKKES